MERREALAAGGYGMGGVENYYRLRFLYGFRRAGFAIFAIHARKRAHVESGIGPYPTLR